MKYKKGDRRLTALGYVGALVMTVLNVMLLKYVWEIIWS